MKSIIYIAGPMTGLPDLNRKAFHAAERRLRTRYIVLSPAHIGMFPEGSWSDYMREALKLLIMSGVVYMLRGWRRSKGAVIEHNLAVALGMKIFYEKEPGI